MLILALVGCASNGSTSSIPPERVLLIDARGTVYRTPNLDRTVESVLPAPPDRVWDALLATYAGLGMEVTTIDTQGRVIGNRQFTRTRHFAGESLAEYLDCGVEGSGSPRANSYRVTMSLLSVVHPDSVGARVETTLTARARPLAVSGDAIYCGTTARLEARIAQSVQERVAQ